jgi:hypothetical protein
MHLNKIKKKESFLFVLSDHGSANIIKSFINKYNIKNCKFFFINKKTQYMFEKYKKFFIKNNKNFSPFDNIIVGTGGNEKKYYKMLNQFSMKSKIYFLIDHWLSVDQRLNFNLLNRYKVNVVFSEIKNLKEIQNKLKFSKVYKIKNYFMQDVIDKIRKSKNYIYNYLYIDDLASYIRNKKIEKEVHKDCVKNFFIFLKKKNKKKIKVLIRPHPSDKKEVIKKLVFSFQKKFNLRNVNFNFSNRNLSILNDLKNCQSIVGSQSSALLLSKKLGKPTYTSLRNKFLRKFASNSPSFKNILI